MKNAESCPRPNNPGLSKIVDFGQLLMFLSIFTDKHEHR